MLNAPTTLTDANEAALEQRAARLVRDAPRAPSVWWSAIHAAAPATRGSDVLDLGQARAVIAAEHGAESWTELAGTARDADSGRARSTLWSAAAAARSGDRDTVRRLLAAHPEVLDERGTHGHRLLTVASRAATSDHAIPSRPAPAGLAVVGDLLAAGADPSAAADHGWTALHSAGFSGNGALAATLLDAGADPSAEAWQTDGATPLAYALFYAHLETAKVLARGGPEPHNLRTVAALGDAEAVDGWFEADGALRAGAGDGRAFYRPLFLFPAWEPNDDPRQILDEALGWAARCGQIECLERLVRRGADVNANPYRGTALLWATYAGQLATMRWLIDHGADVNLAHDFGGAEHGGGATALHLAAQFGNADAVALLLDRGADREIRDALHDGTAAGWAAFAGQTEVSAMLGEHGR